MMAIDASNPERQSPSGRKLVAVVYADMVGYSRLIELDDLGTLIRLRALRSSLIDPAIDEHGGKIVQTGGDSLLIVFDSIDGAVRCAVTIQKHIPLHDGNQPRDRAVRFRIGINIGDAISDGTDLHGDVVNVAARLQAECPPGGICISRSVHDHMRDRRDLIFEELGVLNLRNIAHPVEAFVLQPDRAMTVEMPTFPGLGTGLNLQQLHLSYGVAKLGSISRAAEGLHVSRRFLTRRAGLTAAGAIAAVAFALGTLKFSEQPKVVERTNSIIVLPFRNVDGNSADNYLADAITVEVTTELCRLRRAWVIASSTALTYKDKSIDVRQIGREVGVRYALEGSVRRAGAVVRVNAQLIDTKTGINLWAGRFVYEATSLFDLQDAVISLIAISLHDEVIRAGVRHEVGTLAADGNPLDERLRTMGALTGILTPEKSLEARRHAEAGLQKNPNDAKLLAELADILVSDYLNGWNNAGLGDVDRADLLANQAISLDSSIALAHYDKGFVSRVRGDHNKALEFFKEAIRLNPNFAAAHAQKANELVFLGSPSDAIPAAEEAARLSPKDRSIGVFRWVKGRAYFVLGDYLNASKWLAESVQLRPNLWFSRAWLIAAYTLSGQDVEAQAALSAFQKDFPKYDLARITTIYQKEIQFTESKVEEAITALIEGLRKAGLK